MQRPLPGIFRSCATWHSRRLASCPVCTSMCQWWWWVTRASIIISYHKKDLATFSDWQLLSTLLARVCSYTCTLMRKCVLFTNGASHDAGLVSILVGYTPVWRCRTTTPSIPCEQKFQNVGVERLMPNTLVGIFMTFSTLLYTPSPPLLDTP